MNPIAIHASNTTRLWKVRYPGIPGTMRSDRKNNENKQPMIPNIRYFLLPFLLAIIAAEAVVYANTIAAPTLVISTIQMCNTLLNT